MAKSNKVTMRCSHCGSSNVTRDAVCRWNVSAQKWYIVDLLDATDCEDCGGEASLMEHVEGAKRPYRVKVARIETKTAEVIVHATSKNVEGAADEAADNVDFSMIEPEPEPEYKVTYD